MEEIKPLNNLEPFLGGEYFCEGESASLRTDFLEGAFPEYVAIVDTNGRVSMVQFYSPISPPEGLDSDGNTVVYVYEEIDTSEYVILYYYDFDTEQFVKGPTPPHNHVEWDMVNKSWAYIKEPYLREVSAVSQQLLYLTDWVFVEDNKLTDDNKNEARAYRAELRDFTDLVDQTGDFSKPINELPWPSAPDFLVGGTYNSRTFNSRSISLEFIGIKK